VSKLITFETRGRVILGILSVRWPTEANVDALGEAFREVLARPGPQLVALDFSRVEFFEANLRGKLISLHKKLTDRGGRLALCCLGTMATHPTMLMFATLMPICGTPDEALQALNPSSGEKAQEGV
jgi:anti-anti-sigma regulatory factor